MTEYQIVKQRKRNGSVNFRIEYRSVQNGEWYHATDRLSENEARRAIEFLIGEEIVDEEVLV